MDFMQSAHTYWKFLESAHSKVSTNAQKQLVESMARGFAQCFPVLEDAGAAAPAVAEPAPTAETALQKSEKFAEELKNSGIDMATLVKAGAAKFGGDLKEIIKAAMPKIYGGTALTEAEGDLKNKVFTVIAALMLGSGIASAADIKNLADTTKPAPAPTEQVSETPASQDVGATLADLLKGTHVKPGAGAQQAMTTAEKLGQKADVATNVGQEKIQAAKTAAAQATTPPPAPAPEQPNPDDKWI
jgi:hypothetical protein